MVDVLARIKRSHYYLKAVEWSIDVGWAEAYKYSHYDDWIKRIALIHPEHYRDLVSYQQQKNANGGVCPVRGRRNFQSYVGQRKCQSDIIWDYHCELDQTQIAMDHHFPYSLGGPTLASNNIYLCRLHNILKAADIHFYKWDNEEPAWLGSVIERVRQFF